MENCILTIATGKQIYIDMAATLARSYRASNHPIKIPFVLATDRPRLVPTDVSQWAKIVEIDTAQFGEGFEIKLSMDLISPAKKTLFIDADCLAIRDLSDIFTQFNGQAVSVIGELVSTGEWFGSVAKRCATLQLKTIPRFVGAIYYFDKTLGAQAILKAARDLAPLYDELGIIRLRNQKNEEPLISIAMSKFEQIPIPDDGNIKADAMHYPDIQNVDVMRGSAYFSNTKGLKLDTSPKVTQSKPIIAHFNDAFSNTAVYRREAFILKLVQAKSWPKFLARFVAGVLITTPTKLCFIAKQSLRPLYHSLFGVRPLAKNPRL